MIKWFNTDRQADSLWGCHWNYPFGLQINISEHPVVIIGDYSYVCTTNNKISILNGCMYICA